MAPPENRGGARNVEEKKIRREAVQLHIESFTCRASHCAHRNSPGRKYLPSDLNVAKMHKLFREQNDAQISMSYAFYHSVFSYDFNLGFGHPSKDVCSTCVKFRMRMKDPELSEEAERNLTAMYILHRRRGSKFYDVMNAVEDTFTICFDIMENLVLPKTPIGQAYYSRQLYLYVFGVVRHRGKNQPQSKNDIQLFVWLENQNRKDSNMVASALDYYLQHVVNEDLSHYLTPRLFSDSCYGQNKNINVLSIFAICRSKQSVT